MGAAAWSLLDMLESEPWVQEALCAEVGPDAFFPGKGGDARPAKRVCFACPVREECLEYALDHDIDDGIWGGMSPRERRRERPPARQAFRVQRAAEIRQLSADGLGNAQIAERFAMTTRAVSRLTWVRQEREAS